jgi:hypothetical protein
MGRRIVRVDLQSPFDMLKGGYLFATPPGGTPAQQ